MDLLRDALAVWGIVLTTYLAYREIRKGRRQIVLTCRLTLVPQLRVFLGEDPPLIHMVSVKAVNQGYRPVMLESAGLRISDGSKFMQFSGPLGDTPLPKKLEEHDSVTIFFEASTAQERLEEQQAKVGRPLAYVDAVVEAADGKQYTTRIPPIQGLTVSERPWWRFWHR